MAAGRLRASNGRTTAHVFHHRISFVEGRWSKIPLHHPASDMSYVPGM